MQLIKRSSDGDIMIAYIILRNMIVADERHLTFPFQFDNIGSCVKPMRDPDRFKAFFELYR
jgi:hypothetical protein